MAVCNDGGGGGRAGVGINQKHYIITGMICGKGLLVFNKREHRLKCRNNTTVSSSLCYSENSMHEKYCLDLLQGKYHVSEMLPRV